MPPPCETPWLGAINIATEAPATPPAPTLPAGHPGEGEGEAKDLHLPAPEGGRVEEGEEEQEEQAHLHSQTGPSEGAVII